MEYTCEDANEDCYFCGWISDLYMFWNTDRCSPIIVRRHVLVWAIWLTAVGNRLLLFQKICQTGWRCCKLNFLDNLNAFIILCSLS